MSSLKNRRPLDLLYTDVWGLSTIRSIDGYSYFITFVDHFTKNIWFFSVANKSNAFSLFPKFKVMVEKYFKTSINTIYSDGGKEYHGLKTMVSNSGIQHLFPHIYSTACGFH